MKSVEIGQTTQSLADFVRNLGHEPVEVTDKGTPLAVVLPIEEPDDETRSLSKNPKFLEIIQRSLDSYEKEGGLTEEEVRRELGIG